MGHEVTLPADSRERAFLEGTLLRLADQVGRRLRGEGYLGSTVVLKLRDHRFRTITRQKALPEATDAYEVIYETVRALFEANWKGDPVRLIGVSMAGLSRAEGVTQQELFAPDEKKARLRAAIDKVRDKLGESSLVPAGALARQRAPSHVPFGVVSPRRKPPAKAGEGGKGGGSSA
jgi:DNA polymerase-4